jgi:hypothetical protein
LDQLEFIQIAIHCALKPVQQTLIGRSSLNKLFADWQVLQHSSTLKVDETDAENDSICETATSN